MTRNAFVILAWIACVGFALAGEGALIDGMEDATYRISKPEKAENPTTEAVEGKVGKAVKFTYPNNCSGVWLIGKLRGGPDWDSAAGFSFWVKGDGSDHLGGLQFVWNEDYALRYTCAFPIDSTEWKKITIAWRDLIPFLPNENAKPIDPKNGNAPSKLGQMWVGKWFAWADYAAHSFAIDEVRLEPAIELDTNEYKPTGAPLARVLEKLKAKKPVTIVTMGDSLTDYKHNSNQKTNWPTMFKTLAAGKFGMAPELVNPAIGGSLLRQGLVIMPRWLKQAPEPDLVTICYGFNDHDSKMTPELFVEAQKEAVDRVRRATKGKADVLIITTCPAVPKWDTLAGFADACRKAAADRNAGLCDTYAALQAAGKEDKAKLFSDGVHLSPAGQEVFAKTVLEAIEKNGQ